MGAAESSSSALIDCCTTTKFGPLPVSAPPSGNTTLASTSYTSSGMYASMYVSEGFCGTTAKTQQQHKTPCNGSLKCKFIRKTDIFGYMNSPMSGLHTSHAHAQVQGTIHKRHRLGDELTPFKHTRLPQKVVQSNSGKVRK
jgi:hypothetical protein